MAQELGDPDTCPSQGRFVAHDQSDSAATTAWCWPEAYGACMLYGRAFPGVPNDALAHIVRRNVAIPLQLYAAGQLEHPVRCSIILDCHGLKGRNESRQVGQIAPKVIAVSW